MIRVFYYLIVRPALFLLRLAFLPVKLICRLFSWILSKVSGSWAFRHADMDAMDGWEFEEYAARLLRLNGFHHVELTRGRSFTGAMWPWCSQTAIFPRRLWSWGIPSGWSCGIGRLCGGWCGGSSERKMKQVIIKCRCGFVYTCACFFLCIVYICIIMIRKGRWIRGNAEIED